MPPPPLSSSSSSSLLPRHRSFPSRLFVAAFVWIFTATHATTAAAADATTCSTHDQCCSICGADSIRCARGPCSTNAVTKSFFDISVPTTDVGFWDVLFSFYGMVPYLVPIFIAIEILLHRRSWTRLFAFVLIPIGGIIDVTVVAILGDCADCFRPCGACVPGNGLPSGHALNAVSFGLWVILETLFGIGRRWSILKRVVLILGTLLLFGPVPYSRLYLGDHKDLQVWVGCAIGAVLGPLYFVILRFVVAKHLDKASQWLGSGRCPVNVDNDFATDKRAPSASSLSSALLQQQRARETSDVV